MRDMALSIGLIGVVVLLFVWLNGGLSISGGRPADTGSAPTANAVQEFADAPRVLPFAPAVPKNIPAGWHPNSAATTDPESAPAGTPLTVRGGWLVDGRFIALVATNAAPTDLLSAEFAAAAPDSGTVWAGGAEWTVTAGLRSEVAWFRTGTHGITYLITGSADQATFRSVADSIAGG